MARITPRVEEYFVIATAVLVFIITIALMLRRG